MTGIWEEHNTVEPLLSAATVKAVIANNLIIYDHSEIDDETKNQENLSNIEIENLTVDIFF